MSADPALKGAPRIALVLAALALALVVGRATAPRAMNAESAVPGPTLAHDGVPLGYARTRGGAAAAALNYSSLLGRLELQRKPERDRILRALATPELTSRAIPELDRVAGELGRAGYLDTVRGRTVYLPAPLAYRVVDWSGRRATVATWSASVLVTSNRRAAPVISFQTAHTSLEWRGGDWRFAGASRRVPGPAPAIADKPTASAEFLHRIDGFGSPSYGP